MAPRNRRSTKVWVAILCAIVLACGAFAQEPCVEKRPQHIDIFVDRATLDEICQLLELSDEQRAVACRVLEEYQREIGALDERAGRELRPLADQLQTRQGEELRETPERIEIAEQFRATHARVLQEADGVLREMLAGIAPTLTDQQLAAMPRVEPLIRRRSMLRRDTRGDYAPFTNIDMLALLSDAQGPNGELSGLSDRLVPLPGSPPEEAISFAEAVRLASAEYEAEVDAYLVRRIAEGRRSTSKTAGRIIDGTQELDAEHRALARQRGRNWDECYRASDKLRVRINDLLLALDEPKRAAQFDSRFKRAYAPDLYKPTRADRLIERVRAADLPADLQAAAKAEYERFGAKRDDVRNRAFTQCIAIMKEHGATNMVVDREHEKLMLMMKQLRDLDDSTRTAICNVVGWDETDPRVSEK